MLGFGRPADQQARRQWWRRQVERHHNSNLSVAEFCRRLGVGEVSFYAWRRRFRDEVATPRPPVSEIRGTRPTPIAHRNSTAAFVPVSILEAAGAGKLEIDLGNTCVLRLTGTVDPNLLRVAIRAAGRLGGGRGGD